MSAPGAEERLKQFLQQDPYRVRVPRGPKGVTTYGEQQMCRIPDYSDGPTGVDPLERPEGPSIGPAPTPRFFPAESNHVEVFVLDYEKVLEIAKKASGQAGAVTDVALLVKQMEDFGFKAFQSYNYYLKTYNGRQFIVFKGYPGLRSTLTGTKYLADNSKVLSMAIGRKGIAMNGLKSGVLTLVLVAAVDIAEYVLTDEATLADLGVTLFSDLSKAAIASTAGAVAGLAVGAFVGTVALPIVAGIAVGVVVGLLLDKIDEEFELTKTLQEWLNEEVARVEYETGRWWQMLNTPEGIMWLQQVLR